MARRKRTINRSQSIDDFPLPPGIPHLMSSKYNLGEKISVPELNRNYRFPGKNGDDIHSVNKVDDPGETYMRLLCETDMLANQWANDYMALESSKAYSHPRIPSDQFQKSSSNNEIDPTDKRKVSLKSEKKRHETVLAPAFPFQEFAEWDLKSEADNAIDDYNGEDVILPHNELSVSTSPMPPLSSFHLGRLQRKNHFPLSKRDIPILEHAAYAHSFLLAQNRAWKELEFEAQAAIRHEKILRETREAVSNISEAGFDFGFEKPESGALSPTRSQNRQSTSPATKNKLSSLSYRYHDNVDNIKNYPTEAVHDTDTEERQKEVKNHSISIKRSVSNLPLWDSHHNTTPPDTQESSSIIWSSQPQNYNFSESEPNSRHAIVGNPGADLMSPPSTPKSAPRQFITLPDLSDVLSLNIPMQISSPSESPTSRSTHEYSLDRKCSDSSCSATIERTSSSTCYTNHHSNPTINTSSINLDSSRNHVNHIKGSCTTPPQPQKCFSEKQEQRKPLQSTGLWLKVKTSMIFSKKKSQSALPTYVS